MHWRSLSVAALFQFATAWTPLPASSSRRSLTTSTRSPLAASTTTVLEELPVSSNDRTIAEGVVISRHAGGLVAVRLTEEAMTNPMEKVEDKVNLDITPPSLVKAMMKPVDGLGAKQNDNGDYLGKQVVFPDGVKGVVIAHRPPLVFCFMETKPSLDIHSDEPILIKSGLAKMTVSSQIMDCFGRRLSGESCVSAMEPTPIFAPIPKISDIALINHPMITGVTMFDALSPIGRGQNMLMVGDDLEEMQAYAQDFIRLQLSKGTKCVYASTHEVNVELPKDENMYLVAPSSKHMDEASSTAEAVAIASAACAVAESFALGDGQDTIVVVDTIDLHKKFWGVTTKVLMDTFGIDAVVQSDRDGGASSEMRGFFSSLVQRAAQFKPSIGGGSVTLLLLITIPKASEGDDKVYQSGDFEHGTSKIKERINLLEKRGIPLTAENLRKVDIPIPSAKEGERRMVLQHVDDLISMSDGQIWLDDRLRNLGRYPPIDPQRSVTRVGIGADTKSRADAPALRRIVEGIRLEMSQAASMDGAERNAATETQMKGLKSFLLAMHQPPQTGLRNLSESCVAIIAAQEGQLDHLVEETADPLQSQTIVQNLIDHVAERCKTEVDEIDASLDLSEGSKKAIIECIEAYFEEK